MTFKSRRIFDFIKKTSKDHGTFEDIIKKVQGVFLFQIYKKQGEPKQSWTVDLKNPPGAVYEGKHGKIDATFILSDDSFVSIVNGEVDPQELFMAVLYFKFNHITRAKCEFVGTQQLQVVLHQMSFRHFQNFDHSQKYKIFKFQNNQMEPEEQKNQQPKQEKVVTKYEIPTKKLKTPIDLAKFVKGKSYINLMTFIADMQQSVKGKPISATKEVDKFEKLTGFLRFVEKLMEETPIEEGKMRFGNKAFKTFHKKVEDVAIQKICEILPEQYKEAAIELNVYFLDSFGSNIRIDYGTGHELAFITFLYCLMKLEVFGKEDYEIIVHTVFYLYIGLMRKLQLKYSLEPAGSHGVWGLDDYHFLPFLFGAAELLGHQVVKKPEDAMNEKYLAEFSEDFMYLSNNPYNVSFIKKVKKGVPLSYSSPQLWNISAAKSWEKVAHGMIKMYQAEVLHKHPISKHIFFGTIFPFN